MAYKCRICGLNAVEHQGDICELCAAEQDPYAGSDYSPRRGSSRKILLNGGAEISNTDPYGNDITPDIEDVAEHIFSAGQTSSAASGASKSAVSVSNFSQGTGSFPITTGVTKNITVDYQRRFVLLKWLRSLTAGIPFSLEDEVTMFQVFPDFTGVSLNAQGNACDQVIVYGKLNNGAISENNDVEVFGRRDSNNNIIAKTIRNKASGTAVTPMRTISAGVVWIITLCFLALAAVFFRGKIVAAIIGAAVITLCFTKIPKFFKVFGIICGILLAFFLGGW